MKNTKQKTYRFSAHANKLLEGFVTAKSKKEAREEIVKRCWDDVFHEELLRVNYIEKLEEEEE